MKYKIIRKTLLILITTLLILSTPLYSNAFSFDSLITAGEGFINEGSNTSSGINAQGLKPISDSIANILLVIAIGVTLITAVMMGINFTIQNIEDKAKIKESMVPWIIGIFVTFGAYGIWRITMTIFYDLINKI